VESVHGLRHFIVERIKTARQFLKAINHPVHQNDFVFHELDKHQNYDGFQTFFDQHINQHSIGLLSEAGLPCIADPGSQIVRYAHSQSVVIEPLSGSSSIFLALMASGCNGQNFKFNGYLALDHQERSKMIKNLENTAQATTQIFMEAPYRNNALIELLVKTLHPNTRLCVASEMETAHQLIISKSIKQWATLEYDFHKKPCIYIISSAH
jgi:16S rRNA (cytidine1402-2'-O)-methyltransferase